jgi:hypothetical protein
MTPENKNIGELSADQQRFLFLTKQAGLEYEEALHAIGRRRGAWPKHQRLTRQEQLNKVREYVRYGLTEQEAQRVVGLSLASSDRSYKSKSAQAKNVATLDWMPAKKAYNLPSPGRSKKGLLK